MKKPKVISRKNIPTRLPVFSSITVWLLLDRLHAPGWVWGSIGALFAIYWIAAITAIWIQEDVELFKD